jgi:hypothetical protein
MMWSSAGRRKAQTDGRELAGCALEPTDGEASGTTAAWQQPSYSLPGIPCGGYMTVSLVYRQNCARAWTRATESGRLLEQPSYTEILNCDLRLAKR